MVINMWDTFVRKNDKFQRKIAPCVMCCLWVLMGILLINNTGITAHAEESSFSIEAGRLPSDADTCDVQLSIENQGADWEGVVRLIVDEEYLSPSAYDTAISLPQGSAKQFVVKVPQECLEETDGTIRVSLWDKKDNKVAEKEFKRLLTDDADALALGILSDDYSTLTYLDMGGEELYFYGEEYPIKLVEVKQENIVDLLDTLEFLVIDTFNTGVLTEEELKAIELWNYDGGVLIVGTGSYAENTLAGLRDSYLKVDYLKVYAPGEINLTYSDYLDYTQLHIAELRDLAGQYNAQYLSNSLIAPMGDGAVGILPYALTDIPKLGNSGYGEVAQENFVRNMLDLVSMECSSRYDNSSYYSSYDNAYMLRRMLRMMGNFNSSLSFGLLKFIVIAYVIFVGPILYLILRCLKKKELYWVAVPVTTLLGIILIFFAGRGFEVVDTKVYSVTTKNLSGKEDSKSYMYCFDADRREWDLRLAKGYEYAGAFVNDNYYYEEDEDVYYHHIKKEGDEISFGIKPSSNFEDCFFIAGKSGDNQEKSGSIENSGIMSDMTGVYGTITNNTGKDFLYYAVIVNDILYVYEELPAGEKINLADQVPVHSSAQGYDVWSNYVYNFIDDVYEEEEADKATAATALGIALFSVYPESDINKIVVIGVTENWDKTVDDNCSEMSYGCLYTIQ